VLPSFSADLFQRMTATTRSFWKACSRGFSWIFFAIAGLAFWAVGKAISEFGQIDRILAEMLGIAIAVATGVLGYILKATADDLGGAQDSSDQ
jgi:hypothetical protein